jgi:hypothetical protein
VTPADVPTPDATKHPPFETVDAYVRHHRHAGHICCACFTDNDLPCCNPGHSEAMRVKALAAGISRAASYEGERDD